MKFYRAFDNFLKRAEAVIAMTLLAVIVAVGAAQVVFRYVFNSSLIWSEEFMRFGFVWVSMLSCSVAMREHKHVSVDFLTETAGPKVNLVLYVFTRLLSVAYILLMIPAGITMCIKMAHTHVSILPISWAVVYASYPVGMLLMLFSMIATCPGDAKKFKDQIAEKGGKE